MQTESVGAVPAVAGEVRRLLEIRTNDPSTQNALLELVRSVERFAAPDRQRRLMRQTNTASESHRDRALSATGEDALADRIAAAVEKTVKESFVQDEVASMLGVSPSTVSRRKAAGQLYAFRYMGRWRFASWQFTDEAIIPGVTEIVGSVAAELHPATVRGVMLAPRPTLNARGRLETPRDFLLRGGDVCRVLEIFDGMK
jgi:hypothetical protein